MAPRPFWKGYLKLSLVTCPVAMIPATTEGEKVRFHTLNRATGNRVVSRYVDAVTNEPVEEADEVKGYERGQNDFVVLEDEEIESVALESAKTIDIATFAAKGSIDWVWFDRPHYLFPDDAVGEQAFSIIREAMEQTKTVAISRLVLYRRERAIMLEPRDKGIVLWTLRYGDEVREPDLYIGSPDNNRPPRDGMRMMSSLIEKRTEGWTLKMATDPFQEHLLGIIASKKASRPARPASKARASKGAEVVDIMDALRKSLGAKKPAKKF